MRFSYKPFGSNESIAVIIFNWLQCSKILTKKLTDDESIESEICV